MSTRELRRWTSIKSYVTDKYYEEARQQVFFDKMDEVLTYMLRNTDCDFDEEDLAICHADSSAFLDEEFEQDGKTYAEATDEDIERHFSTYGIHNREELEAELRDQDMQQISMILMMARDMGIDVTDKRPDEFEVYGFDFITDYLKEVLEIKEER